jgi:NCS1 family nucleobase:cation symporter-1
LYGTTLPAAIAGIVAGNVLGYAILALLSMLGPRYGLPQMMQSRLAFGILGNVFPAVLAFLAGVGWFTVNCVLGAYALGTLTHLPYLIALGIMLLIQVAIVVYGYNMLAHFERITAFALLGGFCVLGAATIRHSQWSAPFNVHAPMSQGGETGGAIMAFALAFSYVVGWAPAASDYSRYLPQTASARSIWIWVFFGGFIPSTILEVMGAATVTALPGIDLSTLQPTAAIPLLLGSGVAAFFGLLTIVLGTLTANCLNLYSGALSALAAGVRVPRWLAAVLIGTIGGTLAILGSQPQKTAETYTNFLLLLATWAAPWAGVVIALWWRTRSQPVESARAFALRPLVRNGFLAWIAGIVASIPFLDQAWFTGWVARANPQLGDISYVVGMFAAGGAMLALRRR